MDVRSFELNYEIISVLYESKQFTILNVILKKILNIQLKLNGTLSKKKYKTHIGVFHEAHFSLL